MSHRRTCSHTCRQADVGVGWARGMAQGLHGHRAALTPQPALHRDLGTSLGRLRVLWLARCGLVDLDGIGSLPALEVGLWPWAGGGHRAGPG